MKNPWETNWHHVHPHRDQTTLPNPSESWLGHQRVQAYQKNLSEAADLICMRWYLPPNMLGVIEDFT